MKEFDFVKAWSEVAYPAFLSLPQNIRDLFWETHVKADGIVQDESLDLPWPENDIEFKNKFIEISAEELAKASRAIYWFGHWGFNLCSRAGSYWKFSMYADQVLRNKLWQTETSKTNIETGWGLQVHQGFLRANLSAPNFWVWEEIGLATDKVYKVALKELSVINTKNLAFKGSIQDKEYDRFEKIIKELKKKHLNKNPSVSKLSNLSEFMTETNQIENINWY